MSVLSHQQRIMSHLMSLDECDIKVQPVSNPRSPNNQEQKYEAAQRGTGGKLIERSHNDSLQQMAANGFQPPSTVQQQYQHQQSAGSTNGDQFLFDNKGSSKAVFMQDQMQQKRAQSTIRVQTNRELAAEKGLAKGKATGRTITKT